jgi:hypothetical protein
MQVKIHRDELSRMVLLIGEGNSMRYFSMLKPSIELCLDDLHIQCTLSAEFWHGRPEIHDPRLSEWLEFKVARSRQGREPVLLTLVPSGGNSYVLRPHSESRYDAFGSEVTLPRKAATETRRPPASAAPLPTRSVA